MQIKLIACDFDDTLTEGEGYVLPEVVASLRNFVRHGGRVMVASGRITLSLERFIAPWKFPVYIASANGTVLKKLPEKEMLFSLSLNESLVKEALALGDGKGTPYLFFDGCFYTQHCPETEKYSRLLRVPFFPAEDIASHAGPGMRAVTFRCTASDTQKVKKRLSQSIGRKAYVTASHPQLVDVNPTGAGKDKILRYLQGTLSITAAETLGIGDSPNDIGLLENAGCSATLANGSEALKKIARFTSEKPRGKGILQCLRHFNVPLRY